MGRRLLDLSPLTIMVVDDNRPTRTLIHRVLVSLGTGTVIEAESAQHAMGLMKINLPDILLVDYRMDGIDGLRFVRQLRTAEGAPNPYIPIIMVTASGDRPAVEAARDAGVNEFLAKPISVSLLVSRLGAVIERARPFVKTPNYFGPDRRRRKSPDPDAPSRRADDPGLLVIED